MRRILTISFFLIFSAVTGRGSVVIEEDMVWKGEVVVGSDLIIPSGVTLTVAPGTLVKFIPQEEPLRILVLGRLIAKGQAQSWIRFTSSSSQPRMGDWWGIEFKSSDSGSVLQNCLIEYGRYGVYCLVSSPWLRGDIICQNLRSGIACINRSSPLVDNCQMWGNGEEGILCKYLSRPVVRGSQIRANPYGVVVFDYSCPFLGSLKEEGDNQIYGNSLYDIYNLSPLRIQAQGNFWKESEPSQIDKRIYDDDEDGNLGKVSFASLNSLPDSVDGEGGWDQKEPGLVAVGMLDSLPRIIGRPSLPVDGKCRGGVVVKAWVDEEGKVTEAEVKRSDLDGDCEVLALEFVKGWRLSPGTYQGKRVRFWTTVPIEFPGGER